MNRANPSPQLEKEKEQMTTATYGLKCCELLKKSDPVGLSVKMLMASRIWWNRAVSLKWIAKDIMRETITENYEQTGLFGVSSKTLTKSVIPANQLLFRLVPSVRHTAGIESGLLRMPDANMERGTRSKENMKQRIDRGMPLNLNDQLNAMNQGLLPTPTGQEVEHPQAELTETGRRKSGKSSHSLNIADKIALLPTPQTDDAKNTGHNTGRRETLAQKVYPEMLTTPSARDWKDGVKEPAKRKDGKSRVDTTGRQVGTKTGLELQPNFVEWMQGFPQNWTDLNCPAPATELLGLKHSETP